MMTDHTGLTRRRQQPCCRDRVGVGLVRLTLTLDPRRGVLRVETEHALGYQATHLAQVVATAAGRAVDQLLRAAEADRALDQLLGEVSTGPMPVQRPDPDRPLPTHSHHAADRESPGECDEQVVTRRRVLRLLERGHTVAEAAERLGVDPELIDRWDDDAATDGHMATRRQLRTMGLRPGGQGPVAVLLFAHRQPNRRRVEHAWLYLTATARPKRTATPAQRTAITRALAARRTCRRCAREQGYYLSTISQLCRGCEDSTDFWRTHATAHGWGWPA